MLRGVIAVLMAGHGLLHLIGFAKGIGAAAMPQLTQPVSRTAGWMWLLVAVLFLAAAALWLLRREAWWMVAVPAVAISQVLLATAWGDAKVGTVANVVILVVAVVAAGSCHFDRRVQRERAVLIAAAVDRAGPVKRAPSANLPAAVRRWFERSGGGGQPVPRLARVRQRGVMRTEPNGKWLPFEADQLVSLFEPGFIWNARIDAAPLIHIAGRDKYVNGRGSMLIKLLSLFPIADARGVEIDQGALVRFLAELSWFPAAARSEYLEWEEIDAMAARATITVEGLSVSGVFRFNAAGDVTSFEARRFYVSREGASLEDWFVSMIGWKELAGVRVPHQSEVMWKLKGGDYQWLKLEITAIEYDPPPR